MKVDKYSQEAELLGKNHIDTSEQLFSYKESVEKEIENLTDERKHLRNKMRHKDISEVELSQIKKEISDISARLKNYATSLISATILPSVPTLLRIKFSRLKKMRISRSVNTNQRRKDLMNSSGDAAEQVVRLSLEGFEVVAKVSGEAAKSIAVLLISALKQEQKTKGKARLTNMIKSGKELKVYTVQQKTSKSSQTRKEIRCLIYRVA